jgi:hypothetical protein
MQESLKIIKQGEGKVDKHPEVILKPVVILLCFQLPGQNQTQ